MAAHCKLAQRSLGVKVELGQTVGHDVWNRAKEEPWTCITLYQPVGQ